MNVRDLDVNENLARSVYKCTDNNREIEAAVQHNTAESKQLQLVSSYSYGNGKYMGYPLCLVSHPHLLYPYCFLTNSLPPFLTFCLCSTSSYFLGALKYINIHPYKHHYFKLCVAKIVSPPM